MAFKTVELDEEELKPGRSFEKFSAIGDKYLGVWLRTEKQTKNFGKGDQEVNVHILWWPGGVRRPGGEDRPPEEYELTGSYGLDKTIEKMRTDAGLRDDAGHLVRLTYSRDVPTPKGAMRVFKGEADTDYPTNPKAKLPPGFGSGAKNAPPPEDDIPF